MVHLRCCGARLFLFSFESDGPRRRRGAGLDTIQKVFDLYGRRANLAAVDGFGRFPVRGCTNVGSFFAAASIPS